MYERTLRLGRVSVRKPEVEYQRIELVWDSPSLLADSVSVQVHWDSPSRPLYIDVYYQTTVSHNVYETRVERFVRARDEHRPLRINLNNHVPDPEDVEEQAPSRSPTPESEPERPCTIAATPGVVFEED